MTKLFYTYIFVDPLTKEPFLVGKGSGQRAYDQYATAFRKPTQEWHYKILELHRVGLLPDIGLYPTYDEQEALQLERDLIKRFGRKDKGTGTLLNKHDGGTGVSGFKRTESARLNASLSRRGKKQSAAHKLNVQRGKEYAKERRAKLGSKYDELFPKYEVHRMS